MTDLPPEMAEFTAHLDAQPAHVQDIVRYCLCRAMVGVGKMKLIETTPGESGPVCFFKLADGDIFIIARPPVNQEEETDLVEQIKGVLRLDEVISHTRSLYSSMHSTLTGKISCLKVMKITL